MLYKIVAQVGKNSLLRTVECDSGSCAPLFIPLLRVQPLCFQTPHDSRYMADREVHALIDPLSNVRGKPVCVCRKSPLHILVVRKTAISVHTQRLTYLATVRSLHVANLIHVATLLAFARVS